MMTRPSGPMVIAVAAALFLGGSGFSSVALANESACEYKQHSPHLKRWFSACEMPARRDQCSDLGREQWKALAQYSGKSCDLDSAVGMCLIGERTVVFYEGTNEELQSGCRRLRGVWAPMGAAANRAR